MTGTGTAGAQVVPGELADPTPSDPRATFAPGNATDCDDVGFPDSTMMGAPDNSSSADAYVSGTVAQNAGSVRPGEGEELNVTLLAAGVVVDAVVVKGGPAHNVYEEAGVLPPALGPPQHYISPFNGGGNIPTISHWFVCYHLTDPEPVGSLTVVKEVIAPDGRPAEPLPTEFTATVTCDDEVNEDVEVDFARGGGRAAVGPTLEGLTPGTTCVVTEDDLGFPAGTTVSFDPPDANTTGVVIEADTAVVVTITNDFRGVELATATITVSKSVVQVEGVEVPDTFGAVVRCDDGSETDVELPGAGGAGTPVVTVPVLATCIIEEAAGTVPAGWSVTYSVDGGPPDPTPPVIEVDDAAAITVDITNDPSALATTTTTSTTSTTSSTSSSTSTTPPAPPATGPDGAVGGGSLGGELPATGGSGSGLLPLGLAGVAAGMLVAGGARRLRRSR